MSSRGFIKAQRQVSLSNINDAIKQSLHILTSSIPPREYWQFILKLYYRGSFKTICQVSMPINPPWKAHPLNTVWIHQDLYFNHTPWEDHSTEFISQFGKVYNP
ncbi:hypothetical protein O181_059313 [Austropuccinia psidii MF-1]|uniref:Uncharacterized protein n=1 Tax=Austropuccinia psidii MF-1 TaxID=1389203 RepID=A0A9Q3EIJ8_9BASI|nr:hypothetical protein [Austropuccinia psidii MF-1]